MDKEPKERVTINKYPIARFHVLRQKLRNDIQNSSVTLTATEWHELKNLLAQRHWFKIAQKLIDEVKKDIETINLQIIRLEDLKEALTLKITPLSREQLEEMKLLLYRFDSEDKELMDKVEGSIRGIDVKPEEEL